VSTGHTAAAEVIDVLVVEDEWDVASTTAEILEQAGFRAEIASTLDEALAFTARYQVRSIVLDHQLADDDAGAFLDTATGLPPVVVVSGVGRDVLAELEEAYGAQLFACRSKPVPPPELIEVVRAAVRFGTRDSLTVLS
jgi:DNA-binding response OmpR family regulator